MSGRSAYVRKTKEDKAVTKASLEHSKTLLGEFPSPSGHHFEYNTPVRQQSDLATIRSGSSGSDHLASHGAYQRVQKTNVPVIVDSAITKSNFRSLMDKKSEDARNAISKTFGSKKKEVNSRPASSTAFLCGVQEMNDDFYFAPSSTVNMSRGQLQQQQSLEYVRSGPPSSKLPAIPQEPQWKRWVGNGKAPQAWNKLRQDPELWDPEGDTLVYLAHKDHLGGRQPAFRVSSHLIENTESQYLRSLFEQVSTEEAFSMPPSPISSSGMRTVYPTQHGHHQPTPPISENSSGAYDGKTSYEITIAPPPNQSKKETIQHQVTTRNVIAMIYQASIVGENLFHALKELQERLEVWLPPGTDAVYLIVEWLIHKDLDDFRNNPRLAVTILAWSELPSVFWVEGWMEAYVHSIGMYRYMESMPEFRLLTPITRAMMQRENLALQVRVQNCQHRFTSFDFQDMWPATRKDKDPIPTKVSFDRFQKFLSQFYTDQFGIWPPSSLAGEEHWLTRNLVKKLQEDFGALYNYLVDREVAWDCKEERSGRKWTIVHDSHRNFEPESFDLQFTDVITAFDSRYKYPHIPHPYPLVPDSIPCKIPKEKLFKKNQGKTEDKMVEKRVALAYTESTNIYLLGSDLRNNDLVEAFIRFEKVDRPCDIDPFDARRGRWLLIYALNQTLASVSVDVPGLRYRDHVHYHLNLSLRGTPPWANATRDFEEAEHTNSFCWKIRESWRKESPVKASDIIRPRDGLATRMSEWSIDRARRRARAPPSMSTFQSMSTMSYDDETIQGSDAGTSIGNPRSPRSNAGSNQSQNTIRRGRRLTNNSEMTRTVSGYGPSILHSETSSSYGRGLARGPSINDTPNDSGYGPGIEKLEEAVEWPMQKERREGSNRDFTTPISKSMNDLALKD